MNVLIVLYNSMNLSIYVGFAILDTNSPTSILFLEKSYSEK